MSAPPSGPLIDALSAPAESLRLIRQYRDALLADGKDWADFFTGRLRTQVEDRSFLGRLWLGPGDEGVALAGWEISGNLGRRGWVYLAEGYRSRSVLENFLQHLESDPVEPRPFISWNDDVSGLSEGDRQAAFGRRGYFPVIRADMRYPTGAHIPRAPEYPSHAPRTLTLADEPRIADLMFRVYEGTPERALFATTLDGREDARAGTRALLHGEVGRWLPEASFGIEEDGRLIAHTLANELAGGLITEVGVDPAFRGKGLARLLLPLTIEALRRAGFDPPRLVVSLWNPRAVNLYQRMGFEFVPGGSGRVWVNLAVLGAQPPSG
jgi:ribosomal protein S18 acetylase RimI-like enzyme